MLGTLGRSPWTAVDALVGLSRRAGPGPHSPVLALLTHTVPASDTDVWRQSTRWPLRTRASPCDPQIRHGVRYGLGSGVFSLASGLPSTTPACGLPLLFGCFTSTTPLHDSPLPCMVVLSLIAFSTGPAYCSRAATGSPGSRAPRGQPGFSACLGPPSPQDRLRSRRPQACRDRESTRLNSRHRCSSY